MCRWFGGSTLAFLSLLVACSPAHRAAQPLVAKPPFDRAALASSVDPGRVRPVAPLLSPAVQSTFANDAFGRSSPADKIAQARGLHARYLASIGPGENSPVDDETFASAVEAVFQLEPIVLGPGPDPSRGEAADLLDFFYSLTAGLGGIAAQAPAVLKTPWQQSFATAGMGQFFTAASDERAALHASLVAHRLRSAEGPPYANALRDLAALAAEKGDHERATALRREEMRTRGDAATAEDWLYFAEFSFSHFDLAAGDGALAHARAVLALPSPSAAELVPRPVLEARLAHAADDRDAARVAVAAAGKPAVDDRLARGAALFRLRRFDLAEPELVALVRDAPDDARPVVSLARVRVAHEGVNNASVRAAATLLDSAVARAHKEADYFDAQVAFRAQTTLWDTVGRVSGLSEAEGQRLIRNGAESFRTFGAQLERFEPARAALIALLVDMLLAETDDNVDQMSVMTTFGKRAEELRRRFPQSLEVTEAARAFGTSSDVRADALAALRYPWPPGPGSDAEEAARAINLLVLRTEVALKWGALELLPSEEEMAKPRYAATGDAAALRLLGADVLATRAFYDGGVAAWKAAAERYFAVLPTLPDKLRARAVASCATAVAKGGASVDDALTFLKVASPPPDVTSTLPPDEAGLISFEATALRAATAPAAESVAAFERIVAQTRSTGGLNHAARAWLVYLARRQHDLPTAKRLARALVSDTARLSADPLGIGKTPDVHTHATSDMTIKIDFTVTKPELYHLDIAVIPHPAFLHESPITTAELRALAK